jgi:hypothetical protein
MCQNICVIFSSKRCNLYIYIYIYIYILFEIYFHATPIYIQVSEVALPFAFLN